jgi:outer membrane protein assembly factor BamD
MALVQVIHASKSPAARLAAIGVLCWALVNPAAAQERYELDADQWQKQATFDPASPEGQLQAIRKLIAQGEGKAATNRASDWIEQYPNHPLLVEAYLLRGDARVARRKFYKSLFDYEYVIRSFPASEQFHTALEREYEIGRLYVEGMNRSLLGMRILPAEGEGEELLIRIQERTPGSPLGEKASLKLADYYYDSAQMDQASEAYDLFLLNYPQTAYREMVMLRLIYAGLARFKGPEFDPTGLVEAYQRLKTYRAEFPAAAERIGADALLVRIEESLALKDLVTANWYEQRHKPVSAAYLYRRLVDHFPQTSAAQDALQRLSELHVAFAEPGAAEPTQNAAEDKP